MLSLFRIDHFVGNGASDEIMKGLAFFNIYVAVADRGCYDTVKVTDADS